MSAAQVRVWRAPVAFGVLAAAGLAAGLLGDGVWDWLSAATLATPLLAAAYFALRPKRQRK